MLCPNCPKSETKVIDSEDDGKVIWRRRECLKCENRFTTYERIEVPRLLVIKRDKKRELFAREKIIIGIQKACEKRPVGAAKIEKIVGEIEKKLHETGKSEIKSQAIGELVMKELKKTDPVAYIRFASVYRAFPSVESFEKEIRKITKK